MQPKVEIYDDTQCALGEGISVKYNNVWWVDIESQSIYSKKENSLQTKKLNYYPTKVAYIGKDKVEIITSKGILHLRKDNLQELKLLEFNKKMPDNFRTNDGVKISKKDYFFGIMKIDGQRHKRSSLFRFKNQDLIDLEININIPNLFIQKSKNEYYVADSYLRKIYLIDLDQGSCTEVHKFNKTLIPDGGYRHGGLNYICFWGSSIIKVFNDNFKEISSYDLPCTFPTSCNINENYMHVTSAKNVNESFPNGCTFRILMK